MSFVSDLFGGSEQKSSSQQTSGPVDVTPPQFKALRQPIADLIRQLFGFAPTSGTFPGATDPSRFSAPLTGTEGSLLNQLGVLGGQPSPTATAGNELLLKTLSGEFLDPASNPFLQATINAATRPLFEQFQDVTLPFTAAGQRIGPQGSSAFDRAAAIAQRGLASAVGDVATNIAGQNFQAERGRQQEGIGLGRQLTAQDIQSTISALQAVALPRLIDQFGIDKAGEEFNNRINVVLQALAIAQGLPVTIAQESQGTSAGSAVTSPDIIGTLLGSSGISSLRAP
jgi:hypothetical protein